MGVIPARLQDISGTDWNDFIKNGIALKIIKDVGRTVDLQFIAV